VLCHQPPFAKALGDTASPQVRAAGGLPPEARRAKGGGAEGNRTPDLVIANDALSQLSYGPVTMRTRRYECLAAQSSMRFWTMRGLAG
jgi:hypothetical protein